MCRCDWLPRARRKDGDVMGEKWIIGEPGGPAGPFYSVVTQQGGVIAMQILERGSAEQIAAAPEMYDALVLEREAACAMSDLMFATTIPSNDDEVGRLRQEWIIAANKASKAREAVLTKARGEVA